MLPILKGSDRLAVKNLITETNSTPSKLIDKPTYNINGINNNNRRDIPTPAFSFILTQILT